MPMLVSEDQTCHPQPAIKAETEDFSHSRSIKQHSRIPQKEYPRVSDDPVKTGVSLCPNIVEFIYRRFKC